MKAKILYLGWSIYRDIVYSGVNDFVSRDQRKNIVRFNQFVLLALLINLFCVISYFYHRLYISALINITSAYFFLVAYFFNSKRKLTVARIVSVVNVNLYLIVISYVEGLRAQEYLLFFPYFLVLTFIVSIRRNVIELFLVFFITVISLVLCFKLSPMENDIQLMNDILYTRLSNTILAISFLLTIIFSYAIMQVNKDNEVAILEEKKFGDTIYNTSLDGVFIVFSHTNLVASCNSRALELFGVSSKRDIEGSPIDQWFDEEQMKKFNLLESRGAHNKNWQGELALHNRLGKGFFGYVSVVHFGYRGTRYTKISILDISNVKMAEFELMKAKEKAETAARVKSRFLSNMSHELRTPLNGIIGASNILLQEDYLPAQKDQLDILKYSSEHMMTLISDILDYNKIEAGKLELAEESLNLKTFVQNVISQFEGQVSAKGLDFQTFIDERVDTEFLTDETRLYQVLSNLLSNAIKFTEQGIISLEVKKIFATSSKASVQFLVKDSGIGIPKSKHKEIFESFTQADVNTTRRYGGTGLGLAIIKKLIGMFNSELVLESDEGQGSCFYFTVELKVNENRKLYINEEKAKGLQPIEGVRILIAEDNPINLSVAKRFLSKWGVEVHEATNGKIAVDKFSSGEYDLLLLDLEMPEMDGVTALREIRKLNPTIPAIAFTAAVYDNMQTDLLQKGFTDFIHKPFRPEDLHGKICYLVSARRA